MSWDIWLSQIFKAFFLPPGLNLFAILIALIVIRRYRLTAIGLIFFATSSLLLLSMPKISDLMQRSIESDSALTAAAIKSLATDSTPRAIVVLSGGRLSSAPEYGQIDTVSGYTLQRLQYASWLQKRTSLPILLTGGSVYNEATGEAVLMNQVMMDSFSIAPKWIESKSKNTAENALFSAKLLKENDIHDILLLTHAWHMARARQAFEKQGIRVIEAPMAFHSPSNPAKRGLQYFPDAKALEQSCRVIQEIVGNWWYQIRY